MPLNLFNNCDERAVFDAAAGMIRPTMALGVTADGLCCDRLSIIVVVA